mmetsp:Transcript_12380/g.26766  ORF Transcript_12380/g.26766 Transcript_12380/m.26766 type:complete len:94 (-) Transcript_12380:30-311(-)
MKMKEKSKTSKMHRKNELEDIVVMFFPPVLFDDVVDTHTTSTKRGGKSSLFLFNQPRGRGGKNNMSLFNQAEEDDGVIIYIMYVSYVPFLFRC